MQVDKDNNNLSVRSFKPSTPPPLKKDSQSAVPPLPKEYSFSAADYYADKYSESVEKDANLPVYKNQIPPLSISHQRAKTEGEEKFNPTPAFPSYFKETRSFAEQHDKKFSQFAKRSLSELHYSSAYHIDNYLNVYGSFSRKLDNGKDDNIASGAINLNYNKEDGKERINAGIGFLKANDVESIVNANIGYSRKMAEGLLPMTIEGWTFHAHIGYSQKIMESGILDIKSGVQVNYDGKNAAGDVFIEAETKKPFLKMEIRRKKKDGKKEEINIGAAPYVKIYQPVISAFPSHQTRIEFGAKIKM